jgi:hypothetical protein
MSGIEEHAQQAQLGWAPAYGRFARVLQERDLRTGVEVGVAFGGHSESILEQSSVETLYGVDPYTKRSDYTDIVVAQSYFDEIHDFAVERLSTFGPRFRMIRAMSEEALDQVPDEIDFVYVDADHTCRAVWSDLCHWHPKVRPGGVIGGHDYDHPDHPGVKLAVDEFCSRLDAAVHVEGEGVWWAERPKSPSRIAIASFDCKRSWQARATTAVSRTLARLR